MNEAEYAAQRTAIEIVHDYITTLQETLDHLGIVFGIPEPYQESDAIEALNALAELSE